MPGGAKSKKGIAEKNKLAAVGPIWGGSPIQTIRLSARSLDLSGPRAMDEADKTNRAWLYFEISNRLFALAEQTENLDLVRCYCDLAADYLRLALDDEDPGCDDQAADEA